MSWVEKNLSCYSLICIVLLHMAGLLVTLSFPLLWNLYSYLYLYWKLSTLIHSAIFFEKTWFPFHARVFNISDINSRQWYEVEIQYLIFSCRCHGEAEFTGQWKLLLVSPSLHPHSGPGDCPCPYFPHLHPPDQMASCTWYKFFALWSRCTCIQRPMRLSRDVPTLLSNFYIEARSFILTQSSQIPLVWLPAC